MDAEQALDFINSQLVAKKLKNLNTLESTIFQEAWKGKEGMTYPQIGDRSGYPGETVKNTAYDLWQRLLNLCGEKVNKRNLQAVVERYYRTVSKTSSQSAKVKPCQELTGSSSIPEEENPNFVGRKEAIAQPIQSQQKQSFALPEKIAPVRNWVGRADEINTLKSHILDPETRAITITAVCLVGLAGIGKTTLASQLIRQLQAENAPFTVAAWETLRSPTGKAPRFDSIIDSLLLTLSNGETTPALTILNDFRQKTDRLVKFLKEKPCLVVLDNVETVLQIGKAKRAGYFADECAEYAWLFSQISETEHQSKVLFTSRETLAALSGRETKTVPLGGLDPQAAVQLLESFNLITTPEELAELAKRYDGHPKALEIVAALIRDDLEFQGSVSKFLNDINWLLVNSLDELLDQVIQRLSNEELMCLSQISVYETPEYPLLVDGIAAQMSEMSKRDVKENVIEALKRRQLLDYNLNHESYQMHPLVEEKASQLLNPDLAIIAHRKAYRHFLSIVKPEAEWKELDDVKPLLRAHYHACQAKNWDEAAQVISGAADYLFQKGYFDQIIDLYIELIPDNWQEGEQLVSSSYNHIEILFWLGLTYYYMGKCKIADKYLQESLSVSRKIGERSKEANSLCYAGLNYEAMGNYQLALQYLQNGLVIANEIQEEKIKYKILEYLGITYGSLGEHQLAIEVFNQSLELARKIGFAEGEAIAIGNLGGVYNSLGEYELAIYYVQQQLDKAIEIGSKKNQGYALATLAFTHKNMRDYQTAIVVSEQLLKVANEIGDKHRKNHAIAILGMAYRELGEYQKSRDFFEENLKIAREMGVQRSEGDALCQLGIIYRHLGDLTLSLENLQSGRIIFQEIRALDNEAGALLELAKTSLLIKTVPLETIQDYCHRAEKICLDLKLPLLTEVQKLKANLQENRD
jgi:tetratricopeptide (TPR) repeat protein